jgi:2-polyprenyl-3-methyl-5-hydroxy-6-metoxy-1,4-benzoquinol methylase
LWLANSALLRSAKQLHERSPSDWLLDGKFISKFKTNLYLILKDYGAGLFPPRRASQADTFKIERTAQVNDDGSQNPEIIRGGMGKPFNYPIHMLRHYFWSYLELVERLESLGIFSPARILETGCGFGWTSEFLALRGYSVVGTTLVPQDVALAKKRAESIRKKGLECRLDFVAAPMEEVSQALGVNNRTSPGFDAVFCLEALHHTHDWRASLRSMTECLKPGGWLLACSEPPTLHTWICYRSASILKTPEIGFPRGAIEGCLRDLGYTDIQTARPVRIDKVCDGWKYCAPFTFDNGSLMARSSWIMGRKKS